MLACLDVRSTLEYLLACEFIMLTGLTAVYLYENTYVLGQEIAGSFCWLVDQSQLGKTLFVIVSKVRCTIDN